MRVFPHASRRFPVLGFWVAAGLVLPFWWPFFVLVFGFFSQVVDFFRKIVDSQHTGKTYRFNYRFAPQTTRGKRPKLPVASAPNYPWITSKNRSYPQVWRLASASAPNYPWITSKNRSYPQVWRLASASAPNYPWITSKKTQVIHRFGGSLRQAPQTSRNLTGYASDGGGKFNIRALGISIGGAKVGGGLPTSTADR